MLAHKRIYLSPPHLSNNELKLIQEAFHTNWITTLGPHVEAFEREIAEYVGVMGAVAVSSGTAALHLALISLGVGPGDLVFCSTLTFVASANPIIYQGATPVFIDSEPESWNMSSLALERAFEHFKLKGQRPKAVVVVNLYGQSADMEAILKVCEQYGVSIIEDAAESLGASYQGKASGSFGNIGIYSFNGNKIITTSGGGMIVSDDEVAIANIRKWASQARDPAIYYQHSELGYNYRLSNVLAAIGRAQLGVLDQRVSERRKVFESYHQALSKWDGIEFMAEAEYGRSTRWLTALTVDPERAGITALGIIEALAELNIEARPVWKPMHLQPLYRECKYFQHDEEDSISDLLFQRGLCLPSGSNLSKEDLERVIESIHKILRNGRKS
ncbi:DegT/DnrJ/EryC1/StrS family aminotransferase [Paenibacillus sp. NPDC058910]|uniref:DegT/DnrJ/EryC1/StrS family aminotransferase n=1 Tax=unclassified Paenibacillus TaxID=185978 RepID=UPI003674A660